MSKPPIRTKEEARERIAGLSAHDKNILVKCLKLQHADLRHKTDAEVLHFLETY